MGQRGAILRAFLVAAVVVTAGQALSAPREIGFSDLPDPVASSFDDPFRDMGFALLEELRTIVRLEEKLSGQSVASDVRPRLESNLSEARAALEASGYDVDALLSQRWTVAKKRKQAAIATNPQIAGAQITMAGFFIPAGVDGDEMPVGYLVPEIGMCSHTPPPPPNQLVRVRLQSPLPVQSPYVPIKASGTLRPQGTDETIFLLDGETRMVSMWTLDATGVVPAEDVTKDMTQNEWLEALRSKFTKQAGSGSPPDP